MKPCAAAGVRIAVAGFCLFAVGANAQAPSGASSIDQSAVNDSLRVLRQLDSVVTRNPKDAAAWYRRGMLAWVLYLRADSPPPLRGLDVTTIRRVADTSLMIAADLAPTNAEYQLAAGEMLRSATDIAPRQRGMNYIERGYVLAYKTPDSRLRARASLARGRQAWLSYEVNVNRIERAECEPTRGFRDRPADGPIPMGSCPDTPCYDLGASLKEPARKETRPELDWGVPRSGAAHATTVHNMIIDCFTYPRSRADIDYAKSERFFREAYTAAPADTRVVRHLLMLLAERARWRELAAIARDWTTRAGDNGWAWLALGLGLHRGGDEPAAVAALERGVSQLERREQQRLFSFARLLDRQDSIAFAASDSAYRIRRETAFWQLTDPLWARAGNETRSEFIARVTYAELRWSVEERGVRGADSDRGEIHIRYGPPSVIGVLRGSDFKDAMTGGLGAATVVTFWDYDALGKAFVFWGNPSYGTAKFPTADGPLIAEVVDDRPVSFDNVAKERIIDLPRRIVRFRGLADSTDILVMLQTPVDTIRAASSLDMPPRLDFWLSPRDVASGRTVRDSATMRGSGAGRLIYRVPWNNYFYRIEATAEGSMVAARDMGWIAAERDSTTGFSPRGFGVSDILVAAEARPNKAQPLRWTDFSIAAALPGVARGGAVHLLWENYDLGAQNGQVNYSITVTIQAQSSDISKVASSILGTLARSVGIEPNGDRIVYRFDRTTASAAAVVDYVAISLATAPPGLYSARVEIEDRVSGRRAAAGTTFVISK